MSRLIFENLNKYSFLGVGEWGIPANCGFNSLEMPEKWVSFCERKSVANPANYGLHFFIDDYRFQAVWTHPDRYIDLLRRFKVVLSPDFSMYTDMPKALQLYNHYRKQWLGAYWQECGVTVVPTVSWSDEDSFSWCFDGVPEKSVVAVSSVGTQKKREAKQAFAAGYARMMEHINPTCVIYHGRLHSSCIENVFHINETFTDRFERG